MTTPTPLTDLPLAENLLMTEHVGAVEANDTEILKVEAEHTQEEIEHLTTDYDTSKDTSASSQPEREATLQSDNVDITEGSVQ
ncbi:MAG: hypothetical protein LBG52_04740 [Candidatus Peribacteria bacterium]|jgi:hypothetical protein|nr:hypothetical protein [Candidatus Peribacteria bacterium]